MVSATMQAPRYQSKHKMITNMFSPVPSKKDAEKFKLSNAQINFFHQNGYLPNNKILDQTQLEQLRTSLEDIVYGRNPFKNDLVGNAVIEPEKGFAYFQGAWYIDKFFHDLVFHPAITVPISQLLGTDKVRFWHDQIFYKPAKIGTGVSWHQDYSYWQRTRPAKHITLWLGLDDATAENGCLEVIPGSHKWGLLPTVGLVSNELDNLKEHLSAEQLEKFKPVKIEMKAGFGSFHHDHTVHGSQPNKSLCSRRGIVLNYMAYDVVSADGSKPIMPCYPLIPEGQMIEGEPWPIVVDLS